MFSNVFINMTVYTTFALPFKFDIVYSSMVPTLTLKGQNTEFALFRRKSSSKLIGPVLAKVQRVPKKCHDFNRMSFPQFIAGNDCTVDRLLLTFVDFN